MNEELIFCENFLWGGSGGSGWWGRGGVRVGVNEE